ncbi:enoyl-CoA hydratase/isomerase family protein [uncultured Kordia sp.]|uniref:enoyl-CoA hydratase/isomerase family protein n=1 Tax=uncultured Kordia sp. TaxID=507699 RepID=UPI0026135561|nr:enoyl-CoA hydratase/isomerase family protein [uncultured Kordia sp.]
MTEKRYDRFVNVSMVEGHDEIKIVHLNRPEKANAYNEEMINELEATLNEIYDDDTVGAIILTGNGESAFCAGADKNEFSGKTAENGLNLKSRMLFDKLANASKISIAALNGAAIGGGLELALACDMRVCAPNAEFGFPELELGLTPAAGGMRRLPPVIGLGKAKEMIFFGKKLNADEAAQCHLVSHVGNDFMAVAIKHAAHVAQLDPLAITLAKKVLHSLNQQNNESLESVVQALLYERKFK